MPQIVKLYLLGGSSLMGFVFCATSPIIQLYFMKLGIVFKTKEEAIACAEKMLAVVKREG